MEETAPTMSPPSEAAEERREESAGDEARVGHEKKSGG